ncbi:MAG: phosphoglycerate kinase [Candidatus Berkelbacteria bacterium]
MAKKTINDLGDISGKRVLVRVDFNVPINPKAPTTRDEAVITDDSRIKAAIPTIEALLAKNARVILASHMGRPDGNVVEGLRLDCVAKRLRELIPQTVVKIDDCIGPKLAAAVLQMNSGTVLLLENIRFVAAEESKDEFARTGFAARLADYVDIYVNDAFGTAHRDHASTCSIAKVMNEQGKPCVAGLLMEKELKFLGVALEDPAKPFVVVLGGAKVKDKIPLIENLIGKADKILIGGAMVFTFWKAMGVNIGGSLCEDELVTEVLDLMKEAKACGTEIVCAIDAIASMPMVKDAKGKFVAPKEVMHCYIDDGIPDGFVGYDVGPATVDMFEEHINNAGTVVWNGPMGVFEVPIFSDGTNGIADAMADSKAMTIVGGGDSAAAVTQMGYADHMTFISTGGGASLEFLEGTPLPGVIVLDEKY